jgi:hypothetical protein
METRELRYSVAVAEESRFARADIKQSPLFRLPIFKDNRDARPLIEIFSRKSIEMFPFSVVYICKGQGPIYLGEGLVIARCPQA